MEHMDGWGRSPSAILEEWRRAEQTRDELEPGTDASVAAERRVMELMAEYQDAMETRSAEAEDLARRPGMPIEGDAPA